MPLREVELDTPIVVTHATEQLVECKLYDNGSGTPQIAATWIVPDESGVPQHVTRNVPSEAMAAVMGDPAMVALLDAIVASTRSSAGVA